MIRLGLRFTLGGGKENGVRLVATAVAVALGVGLLLTTLAGINAVNAQIGRLAWLTSGVADESRAESASSSSSADVDPLWWRLDTDTFDSEIIARVDLAATGPDSPVPPGIPALPGPGELYASPELSELLSTTPVEQLGDRYPERQVGVIGDEALTAPDSLAVVVGHDPDELADVDGATQVSAIATTSPAYCEPCRGMSTEADGINFILAVVAGALIFPVMILIGTTTRLAAARREQRFAAMRLVGATPRQVSTISAVESTVVAAVGVVGAFGLFLLLRGPVAGIPFTGDPFFPEDMSLNLAQIVSVAVGVPVAAVVASRLALRRVQISPLGVTRRTTPPAPRAWRLLPLLAGLGELAVVVAVGRPDTSEAQIQAYGPGFLLTMVGLMVAGPWLTMAGSRLLARRTGRPAALIAGKRLADNPRAGFRAISGLVLALFVTSVAVGVISTVSAEQGTGGGGDDSRNTLTQQVDEPGATMAPLSSSELARLSAIPGVQGVTRVYPDPEGRTIMRDEFEEPAALVACAELERTPALGRCEEGAEVGLISERALGAWDEDRVQDPWPDAGVGPEALRDQPLVSTAVATDGSRTAIEETRTLLGNTHPDLLVPMTQREIDAQDARTLSAWQQLANVVVLMSLVIAGCSLAVSVAAGLLDRKRPFSLLRLTGVPLGVLRRVVALESAVPLLLVALVSATTGFAAAHLFLRAQLDYGLRPPDPSYYAVAAAGLLASLTVIASTLPLLTRLTSPESARNE